MLSCEQESISDTDISLKKEKPKIDPVFQNIVDFSKELNNEVISRSNETYTPEELEVLVEGSINYLHTKPAIVDNSPEFYIDSTVTTLVGESNGKNTAASLYKDLRTAIRGTFNRSQKSNKWIMWADIELIDQSGGTYKAYWRIKIGSDENGLKERSTSCTFGSGSSFTADNAHPEVASCAYANVDYEGAFSSNNVWYNIASTTVYSVDYGGWEFRCKDYSGATCPSNAYYICSDLKDEFTDEFTTLGLSIFTLNQTELNSERSLVESEATSYRDVSSNYEIIDIDSAFDALLCTGTLNFWDFSFTKAKLGTNFEPEGGGEGGGQI